MKEVPILEKLDLTIEEAAAYSGIGINKTRELLNERDCDCALKIGNKKTLIKKVKFEKYIMSHEAL